MAEAAQPISFNLRFLPVLEWQKTLTAPEGKVQGCEFYLSGCTRWSGLIPLRGFWSGSELIFFFTIVTFSHIYAMDQSEKSRDQSKGWTHRQGQAGRHRCNQCSWLPGSPLGPSKAYIFLFYHCQVEARLFPISKLPVVRRSQPTCH